MVQPPGAAAGFCYPEASQDHNELAGIEPAGEGRIANRKMM
jgi:hypothetical protein